MDERITILEREVALLLQYVEFIGRICFQYMPPAGQDQMQRVQDGYHEAREKLRQSIVKPSTDNTGG